MYDLGPCPKCGSVFERYVDEEVKQRTEGHLIRVGCSKCGFDEHYDR